MRLPAQQLPLAHGHLHRGIQRALLGLVQQRPPEIEHAFHRAAVLSVPQDSVPGPSRVRVQPRPAVVVRPPAALRPLLGLPWQGDPHTGAEEPPGEARESGGGQQ